ncbi:MAG: nucleoside triphosphate pyrophosphohydrolase, partial [Bacteroidota bacterium]
MNENLIPAFQRIFDVVAELREKCPWDREQTKESLRHLSIEEVYELSDAILDDDWDEIKVEVGDILLHVLFYARLGEEAGKFSTADMMTALTEKLIRRHPHIYGNVQADDSNTVIKNWEQIKMEEKKAKGLDQKKKSVLSGVPKGLPSLIKAMRMQEKVRSVGFDWEKPEQVWEKVGEEMQEVREEVERYQQAEANAENKEKMEKEFGDLMFSLVNYARFLDINPEDALEKTNQKFRSRFEFLENRVAETGQNL